MRVRTPATAALLLSIVSIAIQSRSRRVAVGMCTPLAGAEAAKAAGFDCVELSTTAIAWLSDTANLRQAGYDRRISVGAAAKNFAVEAPRAIALVRGAFER